MSDHREHLLALLEDRPSPETWQWVRERVRAGTASPLEYWMYQRRLDVALLSQVTGFWQWRVRRHLQPRHFAALPPRHLARYAEALGLDVRQLRTLP